LHDCTGGYRPAVLDRDTPSVRERRLARELRQLRTGAQLHAKDVAARLGWSPSKVSRIETARIGIAAFAAAITLGFGVVVLGVPFDLARIDWFLFITSMALGLVGVLALAVILAATIMQTRQDAWSYPEAVAGALFLLVGAVFPMAVLPGPIQAVGLITPLSWWMEGVRQGLFPGVLSAIGGQGSVWTDVTGTAAPSGGVILVALAVTAAVAAALSLAAFRWSETRARSRGLFDLVSGS